MNCNSECKSSPVNTSFTDTQHSFITKRIYKRKTKERVKRWTDQECELYKIFIKNNLTIMNDPVFKRTTKIFLLMSEFIGTKTPSQCRSHHQKFFSKLNFDCCFTESNSGPEANEDTIESLHPTNSCDEIEFPWEMSNKFDDFLGPELGLSCFEDDFIWQEVELHEEEDEFASGFDNKHTFLF